MKKSILFALAGLLIAANASAVDNFTAQNKKDYNNLLKKTTFYKDTQVRKIKYLAASMIAAGFGPSFNKYHPFKLLQTQQTGLANLEDFALYITEKLGQAPKDFLSAYNYAIDPFEQVISNPELLKLPLPGIMQFCFINFNKNYTPLIDTITRTYGKQTRLPRELSLQTFEEWRHHGGKTEPGI